MNTVIIGTKGDFPFKISLICLSQQEMSDKGFLEDDNACLTVSQTNTDLGIQELEKLGNACLQAAKTLKARKRKP
jgi:hypothetical protein